MRQQPAAERREGDVDRGSPEVNRGYQPSRARDPQERRAPATLRLRQTVLHQKASLEQPSDLHRDLAPADPEKPRQLRARYRPVDSPDVAHDPRLDSVLDQRVTAPSFPS